MFKIAVISDIHANLEALESVLADIEQHNITDIISLGDNIGYGPDPVAVLQLLHSKGILTLEGNHDLAVVDPNTFAEATDLAIEALQWTRYQLWENSKKDEKFQEILKNYLGCDSSYILQSDPRILFVHGCPGPNVFDYILEPQDAFRASQYMRKKRHRVCFYGHTHQQVFWEVDSSGVSVIDYDYDIPLIFTDEEIENYQLILNPGSVGQPRDGNPKSGYVIYENQDGSHIFTFKRISYDVEKTLRKIYNISQLDNSLGDRLLFGA